MPLATYYLGFTGLLFEDIKFFAKLYFASIRSFVQEEAKTGRREQQKRENNKINLREIHLEREKLYK
jgi:hypothetical protein